MESLAMRVAGFIEEQGHTVEVDSREADGTVHSTLRFRLTGIKYRVIVSDDDPEYFSVCCSYARPEGCDRATLVGIAHDIGADAKAIKIEVIESGIDFSVEQYPQTPNGFAEVFWRCTNVVVEGSRRFFQQVRSAAVAATDHEPIAVSDVGRDKALYAAGEFLRKLSIADSGEDA